MKAYSAMQLQGKIGTQRLTVHRTPLPRPAPNPPRPAAPTRASARSAGSLEPRSADLGGTLACPSEGERAPVPPDRRPIAIVSSRIEWQRGRAEAGPSRTPSEADHPGPERIRTPGQSKRRRRWSSLGAQQQPRALSAKFALTRGHASRSVGALHATLCSTLPPAVGVTAPSPRRPPPVRAGSAPGAPGLGERRERSDRRSRRWLGAPGAADDVSVGDVGGLARPGEHRFPWRDPRQADRSLPTPISRANDAERGPPRQACATTLAGTNRRRDRRSALLTIALVSLSPRSKAISAPESRTISRGRSLSISLRAHSSASLPIGPCSASESSSASRSAWRLLPALSVSSIAAERLGALPVSTSARTSASASCATEIVTDLSYRASYACTR